MGRCHKNRCHDDCYRKDCRDNKCVREVVIKSLPYLIDEPGTYCLCKDFEWDSELEPAINIKDTNNVVLKFNNKKIHTTSETQYVVLVEGSKDVEILDAYITGVSQEAPEINTPANIGLGISVVVGAEDQRSQTVEINNAVLCDLQTAINADGVNDLSINNASTNNVYAANLLTIQNVNGLEILESQFLGGRSAVGDTDYDEVEEEVVFHYVNNFKIDKCTFDASNGVEQFGDALNLNGVVNGSVSNCNLVEGVAFDAFENGLLLVAFSRNVLIENNKGTSAAGFLSYGGIGLFYCDNITVRNNTIFDIYAAINSNGCNGTTIEGNEITRCGMGISAENGGVSFQTEGGTVSVLRDDYDTAIINNVVTGAQQYLGLFPPDLNLGGWGISNNFSSPLTLLFPAEEFPPGKFTLIKDNVVKGCHANIHIGPVTNQGDGGNIDVFDVSDTTTVVGNTELRRIRQPHAPLVPVTPAMQEVAAKFATLSREELAGKLRRPSVHKNVSLRK